MNKLSIGSIGVNLNDEKQRLFKVFHVGHEFAYFQYLNSSHTSLCKIADIWVLM